MSYARHAHDMTTLVMESGFNFRRLARTFYDPLALLHAFIPFPLPSHRGPRVWEIGLWSFGRSFNDGVHGCNSLEP
jgi:hypothetical protein